VILPFSTPGFPIKRPGEYTFEVPHYYCLPRKGISVKGRSKGCNGTSPQRSLDGLKNRLYPAIDRYLRKSLQVLSGLF